MIGLEMDTCHKKEFHLIAHVVAYAICCTNMNGWKIQTYHMYIVCTICHMQLRWKLVACVSAIEN